MYLMWLFDDESSSVASLRFLTNTSKFLPKQSETILICAPFILVTVPNSFLLMPLMILIWSPGSKYFSPSMSLN